MCVRVCVCVCVWTVDVAVCSEPGETEYVTAACVPGDVQTLEGVDTGITSK